MTVAMGAAAAGAAVRLHLARPEKVDLSLAQTSGFRNLRLTAGLNAHLERGLWAPGSRHGTQSGKTQTFVTLWVQRQAARSAYNTAHELSHRLAAGVKALQTSGPEGDSFPDSLASQPTDRAHLLRSLRQHLAAVRIELRSLRRLIRGLSARLRAKQRAVLIRPSRAWPPGATISMEHCLILS